jgi:hypothetical protein
MTKEPRERGKQKPPVDNDKLIVLGQDELEELRKMLREAQAQAAAADPKVLEKIVADTDELDANKNYVVLSTGKWKTIEEGFKKLAAPVAADKPAAPTNIPYLVTIVIMVAIGIAGVIGFLSIRPEENILVVTGIMFAIITPITTSIMAFMQSRDTNRAVNHRLDAFIESEGKVSYAEGKDRGRHDAEDRADVLAKKE